MEQHDQTTERRKPTFSDKLDVLAERIAAWSLLLGDRVFGRDVSEKLFGPHPKPTEPRPSGTT